MPTPNRPALPPTRIVTAGVTKAWIRRWRPAGFAALLAAAPAALRAQTPDSLAPHSGMAEAALVLAAIGLLAAIAAVLFAWRSSRLADQALLEAGQARTRASQSAGGGLAPEALAAAERVWSARLSAIEAQLGSAAPRSATVRGGDRSGGSDVGDRLEEIERTVAGLVVTVKDLKRPAPPAAAPAPAAPREPGGIVWPAPLAAETQAMIGVRQALAEAVKADDLAVQELLDRLRAAEQWPAKKPGSSELVQSLTEISIALVTALRRGAGVSPLDCSLLSDRVLGALRPMWKPFQPQLDCRSFPPGATFDPDWMEDHTPAGLQRPVISEMLSWAIFEKQDTRRRLLAKARVTAD